MIIHVLMSKIGQARIGTLGKIFWQNCKQVSKSVLLKNVRNIYQRYVKKRPVFRRIATIEQIKVVWIGTDVLRRGIGAKASQIKAPSWSSPTKLPNATSFRRFSTGFLVSNWQNPGESTRSSGKLRVEWSPDHTGKLRVEWLPRSSVKTTANPATKGVFLCVQKNKNGDQGLWRPNFLRGDFFLRLGSCLRLRHEVNWLQKYNNFFEWNVWCNQVVYWSVK